MDAFYANEVVKTVTTFAFHKASILFQAGRRGTLPKFFFDYQCAEIAPFNAALF